MSRYICAECDHGDLLYAISYGYMEGPLGADGELVSYDVIEDNDLQEDTIACRDHGDTIDVLKDVGGIWCEWIRCERCEGTGRVQEIYRYGYHKVTCGTREGCGGSGGSWQPATLIRS